MSDRNILTFENFIGSSHEIKQILDHAKLAAQSDIPVIIRGETGTGKDLLASIIHDQSKREGKYIAKNVAAFSKELLSSELFGHERGSFTGAIAQKKGCFEEADKGTLFLDEIGESSIDFQLLILRALEDNYIYRVGGSEMVPIKTRIITGTNADLGYLIKEKRFRSDLYYRLFGIELLIPPLRERKGDIELLINHFMKIKKCKKQIEEPAKTKLHDHPWSGNTRELFAVLNLAISLSSDTIKEKDVVFPRI